MFWLRALFSFGQNLTLQILLLFIVAECFLLVILSTLMEVTKARSSNGDAQSAVEQDPLAELRPLAEQAEPEVVETMEAETGAPVPQVVVVQRTQVNYRNRGRASRRGGRFRGGGGNDGGRGSGGGGSSGGSARGRGRGRTSAKKERKRLRRQRRGAEPAEVAEFANASGTAGPPRVTAEEVERVNAQEEFRWYQIRGLHPPEGKFWASLFVGDWPVPERTLMDSNVRIPVISRSQAEQLGLLVTDRFEGREVCLPNGQVTRAAGSAYTRLRADLTGLELPMCLHVVDEQVPILLNRTTLLLLRMTEASGRLLSGSGVVVGVRYTGH